MAPAAEQRGPSPLVILSVAKNLVLYAGIPLFLRGSVGKKGGIWVLGDEILHCVQNDKGGLALYVRRLYFLVAPSRLGIFYQRDAVNAYAEAAWVVGVGYVVGNFARGAGDFQRQC